MSRRRGREGRKKRRKMKRRKRKRKGRAEEQLDKETKKSLSLWITTVFLARTHEMTPFKRYSKIFFPISVPLTQIHL